MALVESEARYRTLFEDTLNPIFVVDDQGNYIDANEAALRFLETDRAGLLGRSVWPSVPPELRAQTRAQHTPCLGPRTDETVFQVGVRQKTLLLNVVPRRTRQGTLLVGIGQDIYGTQAC